MKVSKKSLIVSIAVLCVCALSLSAASFAWFSASKNAGVDNVQLQVKAQSDIKIAAVKAATTEGPTSANWVTTLYQTDFVDVDNDNTIEEYIADVYAKNTGAAFDGTFVAPDEAQRELIGDDGKLPSGVTVDSLADVTSRDGYWADFTVYVRTTKKEAVAFNFSDFTKDATSKGNGVENAMMLGVKGVGIYDALVTSEVCIPANSLQQLGAADSGYYYGEVTFYVWVNGEHADCKNANATSLKAYNFNVGFAYAV